jgi:hypothetical protein
MFIRLDDTTSSQKVSSRERREIQAPLDDAKHARR